MTNRLRYYSYYCWVIRHYEEVEHADDEAKWRVYIRRAEALYALACFAVDSVQSDGLGGGEWAARYAKTMPSGEIDLRPVADDWERPGRYLKAKRGNFGQFYIASMTEEGLLSPSVRIPIVSELGQAMATAFAESVGNVAKQLSDAIRGGIIERSGLEEIGKAAHPSKIPEASQEMSLLRNYLLAEGKHKRTGEARRSSAWLLLDVTRAGVRLNEERSVRTVFYNRRLPSGEPYERRSLTLDRWRAFQANELCHIAFEALLNGLIAGLEQASHGKEPRELVGSLIDPLLDELAIDGITWRTWANEVASEWSGAEETLAERIRPAIADETKALDPPALRAALWLIATLWHRWGVVDTSVRDTVQHYAGKGGRSLASVLHTLEADASKDAGEVIRQAVRRHVISEHLAIAGRKLASTGTFTYHFTLSDGLISDGRLGVYTFTNPRLRNLSRFLRDAALCDEQTLRPTGQRFLDENQPL